MVTLVADLQGWCRDGRGCSFSVPLDHVGWDLWPQEAVSVPAPVIRESASPRPRPPLPRLSPWTHTPPALPLICVAGQTNRRMKLAQHERRAAKQAVVQVKGEPPGLV